MNNQLQVILDEQKIAKENAKQLIEAFGAPFEEAGLILASYDTIVVKSEDDFATMAEAREKRIALKNVRTSVENKRKELKEDIVRSGRAIDSVARFVKETIKPAEDYLETQEKFAELKAAERAAKIKAERIEKLMQFTDDISTYNFEAMDDDKFEALIATLKAQKDAEIAANKQAEAERLAAIEAEKKRQAEIEAENAKLRAEAEAREKEAAAERAKLQAEAEAKLAIERAAADEERRKREAIEAEQRAKAEAEAKAKRDAEEAERAALLSPDKQKIETFADALKLIREQKLPAVKSKQAQDIINNIEAELQKIEVNARRAAQNL